MSKKVFRVLFALLVTFLMFVLLFSDVCWAQSSSNEIRQSKMGLQGQVSRNVFDVAVWVFLSGQYGFWDLDIRNEIVVGMAVNLTEPIPTPYVISTTVPFSLSEVMGLPSGANYTYGFWGYPPVGTLSIHMPTNVSSFSIKLKGYVWSKSVFWRNAVEMPYFLNVTSPIGYISSYMLVLVPPSTSRVLRLYNRFYGNLPYREISAEGQRCLIVTSPYPFVVLYESETWEIVAFALMFITIFAVFAIPYALKPKKISTISSKLIPYGLRSKKISTMLSNLMTVFYKLSTALRRLYNEIVRVDSSKLLAAYILCALLMTSLSYAAGPDPRLKVYVLVSTRENAKAVSSFVYSEAGAVVLTNFDEMTEFETLTKLGTFSAVIIGDFFPPREELVKEYIYPALDNVHRIIILKNYALDMFSSEILRRYSDKTIVVKDLDALGPVLRDPVKIPRRVNALGLRVSPTMYMEISAFLGLCSFILFFFGVAFLASKLIEVGRKPGVGGFPEAIAYAIFVFVFTQVTYIVCSVLLAMPLGLHTASPTVTAVGFLGFGGGSRPRMFAGLAGFLFGSLISLKQGLKFDRAGFIIFLVISFFIIIDPLTGGITFYEFILLYTVGPRFETAEIARSYVGDFLAFIGRAFGSWASPAYGISTGIILYYVGAISFFLFPKLKKSTTMILLFFSAFCVASGGIRVADMSPWKTVASLVPGIVAGLAVVAFFCLLSFTEMVIRRQR